MIPSEIQANELMFDALISDWKLEVMSTNWSGYWIVQLTQQAKNPLVLLIDLDNLAAICQAIRSCIDTARDTKNYPRSKTMYITAASRLPTQTNDEGAITVLSIWESQPVLVINYFRGGHSEDNVIRQGIALLDAIRLSDLFATVYNGFPGKQNWTPKLTKEG